MTWMIWGYPHDFGNLLIILDHGDFSPALPCR